MERRPATNRPGNRTDTEISDELTEVERQHNKKTKKRQ